MKAYSGQKSFELYFLILVFYNQFCTGIMKVLFFVVENSAFFVEWEG